MVINSNIYIYIFYSSDYIAIKNKTNNNNNNNKLLIYFWNDKSCTFFIL